jgi:phage terminase small subunit
MADMSPETAPVKPLSLPKQRFVEAYLQTGNASKAAEDAGYAKHSARKQGSRLLTKPDVKAAIARRRAELTVQLEAKTGITLERILQELARMGLSDPADLFDATGRMLPVHKMPEDARRALSGFEVDETFRADGEGDDAPMVHVVTSKPKFWDKRGALELIAKLLGHLKDKKEHEHAGAITLTWESDGA